MKVGKCAILSPSLAFHFKHTPKVGVYRENFKIVNWLLFALTSVADYPMMLILTQLIWLLVLWFTIWSYLHLCWVCYRGNLLVPEMGPSVNFVSAIKDEIFNKKMMVNLFGKKRPYFSTFLPLYRLFYFKILCFFKRLFKWPACDDA